MSIFTLIYVYIHTHIHLCIYLFILFMSVWASSSAEAVSARSLLTCVQMLETLSKLHQTKPTAEQVVLFLHGRIVNRSNPESSVSSIWTSQLSSMSRTMMGGLVYIAISFNSAVEKLSRMPCEEGSQDEENAGSDERDTHPKDLPCKCLRTQCLRNTPASTKDYQQQDLGLLQEGQWEADGQGDRYQGPQEHEDSRQLM